MYNPVKDKKYLAKTSISSVPYIGDIFKLIKYIRIFILNQCKNKFKVYNIMNHTRKYQDKTYQISTFRVN